MSVSVSTLDDISKLTSGRKFIVRFITVPEAKQANLKLFKFYKAEVKPWKTEWGDSHATRLFVFHDDTETNPSEVRFTDLNDFNRIFRLQEPLTGGRKSKKNRRKSKKNRRKSNRRR
jgi:hypothetical protein